MKIFSFKKKITLNSWYYRAYLYYNLFLKEKIFLKRKSYSQFGEDIYIEKLFKNFKKGIYIDIGCYHPVKYSNTAKLFYKGWRGYNIDLNKVSIDLFNIARPKDKNFNIYLSKISDEKKFFYTENLFSSINSIYLEHLKKFNVSEAIKHEVRTGKFNDIVKEKFDFLNIDCEKHDYEIIKLIDLNFFTPKIICIEIEDFEFEIIEYLKKYNYNFIKKLGFSGIFEKNNKLL